MHFIPPPRDTPRGYKVATNPNVHVPRLGIHNGETLSEFPGLGELTSARVLGRLLYAVAGASFKHSSKTLETSENTPSRRLGV